MYPNRSLKKRQNGGAVANQRRHAPKSRPPRYNATKSESGRSGGKEPGREMLRNGR